jgi:hypothetical protein
LVQETELKLLLISLISLFSLSAIAGPSDDNHIHVEQVQTGDNFDLTIDQFGFDIRQKCSYATCNETDFQFHIWGDDNEVVFGQGYENNNSLTPNWNYDGNEPGGNFVRLDIHGDDNKFKGSQKQDSSSISHSITANIYADNNDVYVKQMQNGNKTLTLNIYNDWNEVDIIQRKNGAHTALTGTNPTDLFLTQTGNTAQTYSLSQNCVTAGGCSVSITQGN